MSCDMVNRVSLQHKFMFSSLVFGHSKSSLIDL
jgi:hypothetical protein